MTVLVFKLVGGIGLFLMGMLLLTDGLKAFAGDALRRALMRFTRTPIKAFAAGAVVTALVQSSSATTVTILGFVSAGLITFPQAVGTVIGASFGTTGTGWIVAVLGLKVSVGFYALPLVGVGAFLKLLAHGRWRSLGTALAGFGLVFLGIETLQDAMGRLSGLFDLGRLPAGGVSGHLLGMVLGTALTVVLQSSSAAVAATLTALHTEAINFDQAASLVIGAAVGTTVTGVLAAMGGNVPAKRTALAHVIFNLATGLIALVLLPLFLWGIKWAQTHLGLEAGAASLAAFHTAFIGVGAAVFLPFVRPFSRAIERTLPESGPRHLEHLDPSLMEAPAIALEATRRALRDVTREIFGVLRTLVSRPASQTSRQPHAANRLALEAIQNFFSRIPPINQDEPLSRSRVEQMHAIDHLTRLQASSESAPLVPSLIDDVELRPALELVREILDVAEAALEESGASAAGLPAIEGLASKLAALRREERPRLLEQTARGVSAPARVLNLLNALRWLDGVGYHTWRICHYLGRTNGPLRSRAEATLPLEEKS